MARQIRDLTGQKIGSLKVLSPSIYRGAQGSVFWNVVCECGTHLLMVSGTLTNGFSKSCGCRRAGKLRAANTTHNASSEELYPLWLDVLGRCYLPTHVKFKDEGNRGISAPESWRASYFKFLDDMNKVDGWDPRILIVGSKTAGKQLHRINIDKHYTVDNLYWGPISSGFGQNRPKKFGRVAPIPSRGL